MSNRFQRTYDPKSSAEEIKNFINLISSVVAAGAHKTVVSQRPVASLGDLVKRLLNKYALRGGNYRQTWGREYLVWNEGDGAGAERLGG
jgi:hypothetical protein